ncbi:EamA family transporter [Sporichthya sp.]|uniref:EamA family transporter n=1 Tax=Sporichthya sp. TaxID=65475 RepID=UPI00345C04F5
MGVLSRAAGFTRPHWAHDRVRGADRDCHTGRNHRRRRTVVAGRWQFLLGGIALAGWAWMADGAPAISWTPRFLASLLFLALIGTAMTNVLWFSELKQAPLVALSSWTMLTPAFGVTFGWLLLGDGLTGRQAGGVALVLAALPIILLPSRSRPSGGDRQLLPAALVESKTTNHG